MLLFLQLIHLKKTSAQSNLTCFHVISLNYLSWGKTTNAFYYFYGLLQVTFLLFLLLIRGQIRRNQCMAVLWLMGLLGIGLNWGNSGRLSSAKSLHFHGPQKTSLQNMLCFSLIRSSCTFFPYLQCLLHGRLQRKSWYNLMTSLTSEFLKCHF